ncbi:MAG: hypothetical protein V3V96_04965 [Acidiferrobacterales bacterium]
MSWKKVTTTIIGVKWRTLSKTGVKKAKIFRIIAIECLNDGANDTALGEGLLLLGPANSLTKLATNPKKF